ncbi:MAG: cobalt ECF transporter T component CbiQ, partial [Desulfohalobium sp.]
MDFHSFIDRLVLQGRGNDPQAAAGEDGGRGLKNWDARVKLLLLLVAVGLNVIVAQLWLSLSLFLLSLALAIWSRIKWRWFALFFLAPAWATLAVFAGFSIGFGQTPVFDIGPLTVYREGMLQGASAAARVACDMSWMALVFLSTPFTQVLKALRWFRVPGLLLDTLAMAYRYAFLVAEEFNRMRIAALSRGGFDGYLRTFKILGMILAQIILRAYDRSRVLHASMTARGDESQTVLQPAIKPGIEECPNSCNISPESVSEAIPVLSCRGVSYMRRGIQALDDVSLDVARGELRFLCGPNAAGKTTLLNLVPGLLMPEDGEIYLSGVQLDRKTRKEAFRRVGILSQDPNDQLFCTHVREDVAFGAVNRGLVPEEVERLVKKAMELMEVTELAERPIHQLSYGEMRRVGLAGIIAMQPPLILLDEPAAGLDPAGSSHLASLVRHLNRHHGYTFIIVTHDINLAARLAHRIVILDKGRIIADGPAHDILVDTELLEASRLEPPILSILFRRFFKDQLGEHPIPLTVDEALTLLQSIASPQTAAGSDYPPGPAAGQTNEKQK